MPDEDADLKALQVMIGRRLEPFGRVVLSNICRTAYKILVTHRTGVCVRVLVCREMDDHRPIVNIMPLLDPAERAIFTDGRSFRGVLSEDVSLDPITQHVKVTLEAALTNLSIPLPRAFGG